MFGRPLITCFVAGLLSATGFAPLDLWPVLIIALAVLLGEVHAAATLRGVLLRGWLFGLGHFTVGSNWIQHAFDYQDKMPPALGYGAVVILAAYLAIYPALAMGLAWRFARSVKKRNGWEEADLGFVLAAAAAWILTEWLRSVMLTGYPWNPLGVAWLPFEPVAGIARLVGTYAMSGLMVAIAGLIYLATQRQFVPLVVGAITTMVVSVLATPIHVTPAGTPNPRPNPQVVAVQPNIGQEGVFEPGYAEKVLSRLLTLSGVPGETPRLIVWPEGMVNDYVEDGYPDPYYGGVSPRVTRARIAARLGTRDAALISGNALFFDANNRLTGAGNSVWTLDPGGMLGQRYDKAHLVPFGEYLPLRDILGPMGLARLVMGEIDFVPGPGPRTIEVPGFGKAGIQVCYEIIFSGQVVDPANRPDFLFNPSNDAWFGSWGPPQHLAQARMRAIEEGLPVLRSTPTGITAVIDADGRILGTVPAGRQGVVDVPLPAAHAPTLFSRLGNWMAAAVGLLMLLLAIANRRFAR